MVRLLAYISLVLSFFQMISCQNELIQYNHNPIHILPRQKAPYWSANAVENEKFVKKSSLDYKGKYMIMLFYPFDFTYVCPTELIAFSENVEKFREINAEVVGISTDSHFTHLAWIRTPRKNGGVGQMNIPLVADISKKISRNFGVLVEDELDDLFGAPLRGLFIIDDKGIIRSYTINDAPVGRSVDETIRLIKAFQFADQNGEVCPVNWTPGSNTIKPDPDQKMEYFKKEFEKDL